MCIDGIKLSMLNHSGNKTYTAAFCNIKWKMKKTWTTAPAN